MGAISCVWPLSVMPWVAYHREREILVMYAGMVAVIGSRIPSPPSVAGRCIIGKA